MFWSPIIGDSAVKGQTEAAEVRPPSSYLADNIIITSKSKIPHPSSSSMTIETPKWVVEC